MPEITPQYRAHGRRPRQSINATRDRLLEVGLIHAVLPSGGVRVSLGAIYMEDVIADANISRSSVFRAFPGKEDFTDALLEKMIQHADLPDSRIFSDADKLHALEQTTVAKAGSASADGTFRDVVAVTLRDNVNRPQNTLRPGLTAAIDALNDNALREKLAGEYDKSIEDASQRAGSYFASVGTALGYEMRSGLDTYDVGSASVVYLGGLALTPQQLRTSPSFTSMVEVGADAFIDGYMQQA